jgi:exportin-2 (importin alpha re-exporter)
VLEEREGRLEELVQTAWTLLSSVGQDIKYDVLVSRALHFLTGVVSTPKYAETFSQPDTLRQVVEKVILPNLSLRESDVELFEDEPIEFIRRDLEGSDSETRRRAATDFLRALMEKFEDMVTQVVSQYVNHFLTEYAKDPSENWKSKDTAIYLFSSIAAKGATTAAKGVQTTNSRVNILEFFQNNIASDLSSDDVHVIVKVDAIKFAYVFRSQLGGLWQDAFPLIVKHLGSSDYVVYSYAAIAVERVLLLTNDEKQPVIGKANVVALSKELLEHIFRLMASDAKPEKVQENEFLMKTVMRVLFVIKEDVAPIADQTLDNLIAILGIIRQNPSNPRFYYYFFETIGALIKYAGPSNPEKYEAKLFEPFSLVLANEVQEFEPYVFQLFAALLDTNNSQALPQWYEDFIGAILQPKLWDSKGNVPALVRLLVSTVTRGRALVVEKGLLEGILGIFQELNASKASEQHAFDLIESVYAFIPAESLAAYTSQVIGLMLSRLQSFKTEAYQIRFTRFYHHIAARDDQGLGADYFIAESDKCQNE